MSNARKSKIAFGLNRLRRSSTRKQDSGKLIEEVQEMPELYDNMRDTELDDLCVRPLNRVGSANSRRSDAKLDKQNSKYSEDTIAYLPKEKQILHRFIRNSSYRDEELNFESAPRWFKPKPSKFHNNSKPKTKTPAKQKSSPLSLKPTANAASPMKRRFTGYKIFPGKAEEEEKDETPEGPDNEKKL